MLRNYTPHNVYIEGVGTLKPEGVARLKEERRTVKVGFVKQGLPYTAVRYTEIEGLPEAHNGFTIRRFERWKNQE